MDFRIDPVHIAQRALQPVGLRLEDEKPVTSARLQRVCHAQFERHVEPWQPPRSRTGDAAQVVNRRRAIADELEKPFPPALSGIRDLEHAPWLSPDSDQTCDSRDEERLVTLIERKVEENVSPPLVRPATHLALRLR